jgi:hypothetical protein
MASPIMVQPELRGMLDFSLLASRYDPQSPIQGA